MSVNFLSIGFLGLVVLGVIAVVIAVVVLSTRDRVGKNTLVVGAALAAMAIAGFVALTLPLGRSTTVVVNPQAADAPPTPVIEAHAERDGEVVATKEVRVVGGPPGRPDLPADVWVNRATMFGALAVMVLLAYVFVDAGRRGRYTWPLRIGSAAAFALLCVLLWRVGPLMSM